MTKVTIRFIIQMGGKPVENVKKAMEVVEKKLREYPKCKMLEIEHLEPELDDEGKIYVGMIEGVGKFENVEKVLEFAVDYTPNSIVVEDPENLKLDSATLSGILNDFSNHLLKASAQIRVLNANLHHLKGQLDGKTPAKKK